MLLVSKMGNEDDEMAYYIFWSYTGVVYLCGACCGCLDGVC